MTDRDHGLGLSPGPSVSPRVTLDVTLGEVYRTLQEVRTEQKNMSEKQDTMGHHIETINGRLSVLEDRGSRDLLARYGSLPGVGAALMWLAQHFKS